MLIEKGNASLEEYWEYEQLLTDHGIEQSAIDKTLKDHQITGWEDFIRKRKAVAPDDFEHKNIYEAIVVGSLLGFGLYILHIAMHDKAC